jgi:trk system potassium uptake protein TrkH
MQMTVPRTICLGFLVLITIGALLLWLPMSTTEKGWGDPLVALFTATSAVCVTGLVVVDTGTYFSNIGEAVILGLIQVGGLGYMTANTFLLLLLGRRLGLKERLAIQQSMDNTALAGGKSLILSIIAMTLVFELTGLFCLYPVFSQDYGSSYGLWLAAFHSVSAFNNAGFSLFPDNIISYALNPWVNAVITALVILGGIGYQVIMELLTWLRNRWHGNRCRNQFSLNFKIVTTTTAALLALGTVAFFLIEYQNPATLGPEAPHHKLLIAWFQSVISRTAGFNSIDIGAMGNASLFIMIALMFVGASPGSTGGGIKTTTIRILLACTRMALQGKEQVLLFRRQIPTSRVLKAIAVVVGSGLAVVAATALVSLSNPTLSFIDILFEAVSAFATVGVSTGITAAMSDFGKYVIIATMYLGRVGVLLFMASLLGDPKPSAIQYPEEELLIG